ELELNPQIITRFASYSYLLDLDNASVAQHLEQEIHVVADLGNRVAQLGDLAARVQHGRMVAAAKIAADLRQRELGQLLGERHRDLARSRYGARALLRMHVGNTNLV